MKKKQESKIVAAKKINKNEPELQKKNIDQIKERNGCRSWSRSSLKKIPQAGIPAENVK